MPRLIIDEAAKQLFLNKLPGQSVFGGPNGGLLDPGIVDPIEEGPEDRWQPNDTRARKLVLCIEACREIMFQAERFNETGQRTRTVKALTVPVCSLMDVIGGLLTEFNQPRWQAVRKQWPQSDQEIYITVGRTFRKKRIQGPVRVARNKLGAHLDQEVFLGGAKLSTDDLLMALRDSLILLVLILNHPHAFTWIRSLGTTEDGHHRAIETMYMYPMCVRWLTDLDGHVKDIGAGLTADPTKELQGQVLSATDVYNNMLLDSGSDVDPISLVPTDELREAELSHRVPAT